MNEYNNEYPNDSILQLQLLCLRGMAGCVAYVIEQAFEAMDTCMCPCWQPGYYSGNEYT